MSLKILQNCLRVADPIFALDEISTYVGSGAIIPMQPDIRHIGERCVQWKRVKPW